ncbi:ABC transporter permease [Actinomyces viscosus]|uniref:Transport permease protein n=1 Tax=Actinomyces viscosus TaxID=1656 RepID=A0A448PPD1_ACTVI|nr:ABC transporter permease [Actinomyces viscosus]VEI18519.1 Inner membrane transport permease ybhR [Actinomyces viscosus]
MATVLDPSALPQPEPDAAGPDPVPTLDLSSVPRPAAQRPGSASAAVLTLTWASLVSFVREPMAFVMGLLYPLFMLILFNAVFPGEMSGGITYGEYMLPAMITMGVLMTCMQILAISVAAERESGELRRLAVLPVPAWAYVAAKCLANVALSVLNIVVLIGVGRLALGLSLPAAAASWALAALTLVLTIGACTALGLAVGRCCPSSRAASGVLTPVIIILQFVSGLFLPLSQLPTWMVHGFSVLPVRWSAELMREAFLPATAAVAEPAGTWETGKGLAVVTAWLVGGVVAAVVITRRDTVDR